MPASSLAQRSEASQRRALLSDPKLYEDLRRYVRARVPRGDAEDVVHAALADALAAENAPSAAEELRRWIFTVARNKAADHYRRLRGQRALPDAEHELAAESAPHAAHELLKWAVQELPKDESAEDTLEWMLREGEGDPLEEIARENQLPAPRLRQRVSRLRRYYRSRWSALAALGLLGLLGVVGYRWLVRDADGPAAPPIARETPRPVDSARALRERALDDCARGRFQPCLERLERADRLDPRGAEAEEVRAARAAATRALSPKTAPSATPIPSESPSNVAPSPSSAPRPKLGPTSPPAPKARNFSSEKPMPSKVAPARSNAKAWDKKAASSESSLDSFPDQAK